MDPVIENKDLGPPRPSGILIRGLPVAIVAHVLLAVALAWGVQWKRQPDPHNAAVPLPPVTASVPSTATMGAGPPSTATMGGAPAPAQAQPARPAAPPAPAPAPQQRTPDTRVAAVQPRAPAPAPAPVERVQPSFDCAKARSTPERIICADPELSRMDRDLGRLYARAREASPDPLAFRRHSDAQWFQRERECRDKECLLRWYAMRREQLTASLGEAPPRR